MPAKNVRHRRQTVLALALLMAATVFCSAGGLVVFAWRAIDLEVSSRETQLMRRSVERLRQRLGQETTSAAEWDDAFKHTERRDLGWIDLYLATYYRTSFGHDLTMVVDGGGTPFYASRGGERLSPAAALALAKAAAPVVAAVQRDELSRRARLDHTRVSEVSSLAFRTVVLAGDADTYLVGVSAILPSRRLLTGNRPTMVVISGRRIDAQFLRGLEEDFGIASASLMRGAPERSLGAAPLVDADGRTVATLTWRPEKPGGDVIRQAVQPIAAILFLLVAICGMLVWAIRNLLKGIAATDDALQVSLRELMEARDQAQAGSTAKSRFIANISHEIRTPLNGVLGMAQAMQHDELCPKQSERLKVLRQSGESLLAILNDVLDLAKIEAGKLELEMVEFDLATLASGAHGAFTALADRKGIDFSLTVAPEAQGRYRSDSTRLRQILYNLISNALKFTEQGRVAVAVERRGELLILEVSDTGIGMSDDVRLRLFQSFEQADASTTRRFGGTGLGLAITQELTRRLGGAISVVSAAGRGSIFTVELPLERVGDACLQDAAPDDEDDASTALDSQIRVLAAEDNPVNQLVLKTLLHQVGIEPEVVPDGLQAVEAWRQGHWDLILMDVQMPLMDGPAATRQIRQEEARRGGPRTPIIALTANAMSHQVAEYLAAGMDAYVPKPIDIQQLLTTISETLDKVEATADVPAAAS